MCLHLLSTLAPVQHNDGLSPLFLTVSSFHQVRPLVLCGRGLRKRKVGAMPRFLRGSRTGFRGFSAGRTAEVTTPPSSLSHLLPDHPFWRIRKWLNLSLNSDEKQQLLHLLKKNKKTNKRAGFFSSSEIRTMRCGSGPIHRNLYPASFPSSCSFFVTSLH